MDMLSDFEKEGQRAVPRVYTPGPRQAIADIPVDKSVTEMLEERGARYGSFDGHAKVTQELKEAMWGADNWPKLNDAQKEALEMIVHKIGRIVNGEPNYKDSWTDIIGYAKLVEQTLK